MSLRDVNRATITSDLSRTFGGPILMAAMNSDTRPSSSYRVVGLAATASTLFALVAMSATVANGPAPRTAVAAAMAAAARDLLVSERPSAAMVVLEPCVGTDDAGDRRLSTLCDVVPAHATLLGVRLLDLPPPAC